MKSKGYSKQHEVSFVWLVCLGWVVAGFLILAAPCFGADLTWRSPCKYRLLLSVDPRGDQLSNCPATVEIDFPRLLSESGISAPFDEHSVEVVACDGAGCPKMFDESRAGYERYLVPWRLDKYYGIDKVSLAFVIPHQTCTRYAVHFDTVDSGLGRPQRYPGLVGDGDFFRENYQRREIGATHFDCFCDLDADGDLDLFKGGVEPFIYCYENAGANRFVYAGRLTSGGELFTLPRNRYNNRSWVVPHFYDWDADGDQDFLPSFMDGPYGRRIVFYENVTAPGGSITFADQGPLSTVSGTPLAGGAQTGGWFPSVTFVEDFDGDDDGRTDLLVGSNNHCYLYRSLGTDASGRPILADAVALKAGGEDIELFNPCFEVVDIDADGDWDLLGAPQSGQIYLYENVDTSVERTRPAFAKPVVAVYDELYLQRSTHPRVKAADFTGDGLCDLVVDRAWELANLKDLCPTRDYGSLFKNIGTAEYPAWQRTDAHHGAPYTETFQICDALRQNVVRAADWNNDGRTDLLAGDCDGFIWYFENRTNNLFPLFAAAMRLSAGGKPLSLADEKGHARHDICDWNNDGRKDLIASDGAGSVTVYLNEGTDDKPLLAGGRKVEVLDRQGVAAPIRRGTRSHLLVCDWNNDDKKDIIFSDQENPGFYFFQNTGTDTSPAFGPPKGIGLSSFMRPNLGSFVDWDGDGKEDLIACEFEHSIRFYKNVGSAEQGEEPQFDNPDGVSIVRPYSIMMISGADAVDWNRDGDIDILTGQGHGGSGIRFYERDYIDNCMNNRHPVVSVGKFEKLDPSLLEVVRGYADEMIAHGRDTYGDRKSGLLLSALDRNRLEPLQIRPEPPGGVRRGDRAGLPWRRLAGANPQLDQNLLRVFYVLTEITGEPRYARAADEEVRWFFENAQSPATYLLCWGEHMCWDVLLDVPVSSGTELTHEFSRPWVLWDRCFDLVPEPSKRFALGLWEHQIADHKTGAFDRHAPYERHGPLDGKDFPRHGAFYIHTWAHAYKHTKDQTFLEAIEAVLSRFERKRYDSDGAMHATMGPLDIETAASMVPEPLSSRLRRFAEIEDDLVLQDLRKSFGATDGRIVFKPTWQAGYSSGVTADWAMFALARYEQVSKSEFRDLAIAVADAYVDELPAEDVDVWPMSLSHVISAEVAAYRFTKRPVYLEQACRFARMAVQMYWQDKKLPRASLKTGHYETITGCDSLALSLLEVHAAANGLRVTIPSNTIDR
jgi:hypothetical protein